MTLRAWRRCYVLAALGAVLGGYFGVVGLREMTSTPYAPFVFLVAIAAGAHLGLFVGFLIALLMGETS